MSEIKAIETVYNGYKFRSRLEARWAVFFDAAGIKYEYEPEGFKNDSSIYKYYLPDFYLPDYGYYVEVKPNDIKRIDEIRKAETFLGFCFDKLLILPNIPEKREDYSTFWYTVIYKHPLINICDMIRKVPIYEYYDEKRAYDEIKMDAFGYVSSESEIPSFDLYGDDFSWEAIHDTDMNYRGEHFKTKTPVLDIAYDRARQARFEFGECG